GLDADGTWLLVTVPEGLRDTCEDRSSVVLDPATGEVLWTIPERISQADIGPSGTPSEGLVAYRANDGEVAVVVRDLRSGDVVGRLPLLFSQWRPIFSNDGRYLTFGSFQDGGFAVDVERVLAGARIEEATIMNPDEGGITTVSVVAGDWFVTGHDGVRLRFWNLKSGELELALTVSESSRIDVTTPGNPGAATFIASSPDDRYLYYEDEGLLLRRFPLDADELIEFAESLVQRDFGVEQCERYQLADDCVEYLAARRAADAESD
ncbi:MAG: hypothetical protein AAF945_12695, partial [Actinomycetota bacterium]